MGNDPILGLLGLARRANRLACGEEQVSTMVAEGRSRAIFIATDCGDATLRKFMRHEARVPVLKLACDREVLGQAVGIPGCVGCAVSDIGIAESLAKKLAPLSQANHLAAIRVVEKKAHIDSRKGIKKKKQ